jgi:O-antigen/teichoic acid export membrane protein
VTTSERAGLAGEAPLAAEVRGTHAGLVVLAGVVALNLGNAVFHLLSARLIGPGQYSDVVSLVAAQGLLSLPFGGIQYAVARWISEDAARGDAAAVGAFVRRAVNATVVGAVLITAVIVAAAPLVRHALGVHRLLAVVLTALYMFPALLAPTLWGVAQGLQRFGLISASLAVGVLTRIGLILLLIPLGLGVGGVMGATAVAAVITVIVPLPFVAQWYRRGSKSLGGPTGSQVLRSLAPVVVGVLAITSLTTIDLIAAKVALSSHAAGVYGSASFIGRLLLYLPMTIATVLLPKVTSRAAADRDTKEILYASLAVTGAFSLLGTALLILVPRLVVDLTFGSAYGQAVPLIGVFGLAMTAYALLNVQFVYHLGHGRERMSWLLLAGAAGQIVAYVLVHGSTYQLVATNLATAVALLLVHEVAFESTLPQAACWLVWRVRRLKAP